jgi:chromate transporter
LSEAPPSLAQALRFWHRLGWIGFGGPAGQIAIMHAELVERRRWVDDATFLRGLNFCLLLPGPEAMQLATWLGWRMHGLVGGFAAGTLFVLPAALLLAVLSAAYLAFGRSPVVVAALLGVQAAVLGIVLAAVRRLAARTLRSIAACALAVGAFLALAVAGAAFPLVILGAAIAGVLLHRWRPQALLAPTHAVAPGVPPPRRVGWRPTIALASALLLAWWLPLLALRCWLGADSTVWALSLLFSQAALLSFGGAYAVLPYVAQQAVEVHGWLDSTQMLVGLGLAESTPGPLVIVLEFVGYLAAFQQPDLDPPFASALLGAAVAVWATFLPSFLFVLPAAPWIESLGTRPRLQAMLGAISAAVVGVILNLALWFGWHLLAPLPTPSLAFAATIAGVALLGLLRWRWRVELIVLAAAAIGALATPWIAPAA